MRANFGQKPMPVCLTFENVHISVQVFISVQSGFGILSPIEKSNNIQKMFNMR
jgi:hypothetical protein